MTEARIHRSIIKYLRAVLPGAIIHHGANEGNRGGTRGMLDGKRRKEMGQLAGWPDIIVLTSARPMFFEVKKKGGYATHTQKAMHGDLVRLGCKVAVVRSIDDVRDRLLLWGVNFNEKIDLRGTVT